MTEDLGYSPGATINQLPRPRLLVRGFKTWNDGVPSVDQDLVEKILALAPTSKYIERMQDVRQAEWDILVTDESISGLDEHISVIFIAPDNPLGCSVEFRSLGPKGIQLSTEHISQELIRIKGLPERVATLTHEQLEPILKSRESHHFFETRRSGRYIASDRSWTVELLPFIVSGDGKVLAGKYARSLNSETWLLPRDCPDPIVWINAAFAEWHKLAPDRFPGLPEWSKEDAWSTSIEQQLREEIAETRRQREEALKELDAKEAALRDRLEQASAEGDAYERALLTTQDSGLVNAVLRALTEIGFDVTDADQDAAPGDNLEDLHVRDPDYPNWIALAEVKGYTKGAKTEAITQFIRFVSRFTLREHRTPDACWYIVNQFLTKDPSDRQPALHGKDDDVEAFASSAGGLVIDSVELFKLLRKVQQNSISKQQARSALRNARGRFLLDVDPS